MIPSLEDTTLKSIEAFLSPIPIYPLNIYELFTLMGTSDTMATQIFDQYVKLHDFQIHHELIFREPIVPTIIKNAQDNFAFSIVTIPGFTLSEHKVVEHSITNLKIHTNYFQQCIHYDSPMFHEEHCKIVIEPHHFTTHSTLSSYGMLDQLVEYTQHDILKQTYTIQCLLTALNNTYSIVYKTAPVVHIPQKPLHYLKNISAHDIITYEIQKLSNFCCY